MAKQYCAWLDDFVLKQEEAGVFIAHVVRRTLLEVVAAARAKLTRYHVRFFGSRDFYVYSLPDSDLDLVIEVREEIYTQGLSERIILERMAHILRNHEHATQVNNAITAKTTISFTLRQLKVDLTIHVGDTRKGGHLASALTDTVGNRMLDLSEVAQSVVMLMVDWAKRNGVCRKPNGTNRAGLKAIHWSLLVVAWYQRFWNSIIEVSDVDDPAAILLQVFGFFLQISRSLNIRLTSVAKCRLDTYV